jgi:predicted O-methyltransferase YrrM
MNNELTTRQFWLDYWESKTGLIFKVSDQYPFVGLIARLVNQNQSKTFLEIGGFPGYFSVWAKLNLGLEATLLDYVVHLPILNALEEANGLAAHSIEVIETDLFTYQSDKKYDFVVSNGFD